MTNLLYLVPQYGNYAGNGATDAWELGKELTVILEQLEIHNPGAIRPTRDPITGDVYKIDANSKIILNWINSNGGRVEYIDENGNTQYYDFPQPINGLDRVYLHHDLFTLEGEYITKIMNHLRTFPETMKALDDLFIDIQNGIVDSETSSHPALEAFYSVLRNPIGRFAYGVTFPILAPVFLGLGGTLQVFAGALGDSLPLTARIDPSTLAGVFGSTLGKHLAGDDPVAQVVVSSTLSTVLSNIAALLEPGGTKPISAPSALLEAFSQNFGTTVVSQGLGAISSYLLGELAAAIGLEGEAGQVGVSAGTAAISQIVSNLTGTQIWADAAGQPIRIGGNVIEASAAQPQNATQVINRPWNLNLTVTFATVAASFFGGKLADSIIEFDTVGGQIGAAIGQTYGTINAGAYLMSFGVNPVSFAVAVIAIAAWKIFGGLIGSLFGGTPKAGASVGWDDADQQFEVTNVWKKNGGSADGARSLASTVAGALNSVIAAAGSRLVDPEAIQLGAYDIKGKKYWYRPTAGAAVTFETRDPNALAMHGTYVALSDLSEQLIGGNVFVKRALSSTLLQAAVPEDFDTQVLLGNILVAQDYARYQQESTFINASISTDTDSAFSLGWLVTIAQATELGLHKRWSSDWIGGWAPFLDEQFDGRIDGHAFTPANLMFELSEDFGERLFVFLDGDGYLVGATGDTIDTAAKDHILGTSSANTITVAGDTIANASGLTINGAAASGSFKIDVAAVIDGGDGNDIIRGGDLGNDLLGGAGDDQLVGGKLDDWLFGGDGSDKLFAGAVTDSTLTNASSATARNAALSVDGGNGDLLSGDAGNDFLFGSKGSDWLKGGAGVDYLYGGWGGDILEGGAGDDRNGTTGAAIFGGGGTDQYVFGYGDGQDIIFDEYSNTATSGGLTVDSTQDRLNDLAIEEAEFYWTGGGDYEVDGSVKGGEDAVVFGPGVTMADIKMRKSGSWDLVIELTAMVNGVRTLTGDSLTIKDWFETSRKVEWLRFADGQEIRIGDIQTFMNGTHGNDVLIGTSGRDFLYGDEGDDFIRGLNGDDWATGGGGDDFVAGDNDDDFVLGGTGNDQVSGGLGEDAVFGDSGNDWVYGSDGGDVLAGGLGDDWVVGGDGDDRFKYTRGDGADVVMDGYVNNWELVWQSGAYTNGYVLNGDGTVTKGGVVVFDGSDWLGVYDFNSATTAFRRHLGAVGGALGADLGALDRIEFAIGIDRQDLLLRKVGNDLEIAVSSGEEDARTFDQITDRLTLKDFYAGSGKHIEEIVTLDWGVVTLTDYTIVGLAATDGNDTLAGGTGYDWITGNGGDDTITGGNGEDVLFGNQGNDILRGQGGWDVLMGGAGDDLLEGGEADDELIGGSGLDIASYAGASSAVVIDLDDPTENGGNAHALGDYYESIEGIEGSAYNDTLYGDDGDNLFRGLAGADQMYGRAGDDVYEVELTHGQDTIYELAGAGEDVLELGAGISLSNLIVTPNSGSLRIEHNTSSHRVTLSGQTQTNALVETLQLADGLSVSLASVRIGSEAGTAGDDAMFGNASANTLSGAAGHDIISGGAGIDSLSGGAGDDTLEGGADADSHDGGTDSITDGVALATLEPGAAYGDTIRYVGSTAAVTVDLAASTASGGHAAGDTIAAVGGVSTIENVTGSQGYNDILKGDSRANRLIGLGGDDTLEGRAGDDVLIGGAGADILKGEDGEDAIAGEDGADQAWGGAGKDLLAGGADNDTLYGDAGEDSLDGGDGNDTVYGGDDADTIGGGAGSDILYGGAGDDGIAGGLGGDSLYGDAGNDTLAGETGDDDLFGGAGNDTYVFGANDGADDVSDNEGVNRLVFADVAPERLWLTQSGNDLRIGVIGGTTVVTLAGFFLGTPTTTVREIATASHSLFLAHADDLIAAMTAASASVPAAMPGNIAAMIGGFWHAGGKAAPIAAATQEFDIPEDGSVSGSMGAVDHDENITGYAVAAAPQHGDLTTFNASTGAWTYTPDANWSGVEVFTLEVSDADGHVVRQTVTVTVLPAEDPPGDIVANPTVLEISESAALGAVIGQFIGTDPDGTANPLVSLFDDAGGLFRFSTTVLGRLELNGALNYETAPSYNIVANATDSTGHLYDEHFTIHVLDVNEAPTAVNLGATVTQLDELSGAAITAQRIRVADITVADDALGAETLTLSGAHAALFEIDTVNNVTSLFLRANVAFNHEATAALTVVVEADDLSLVAAPVTTSFTLTVTDINEAPSDVTLSGAPSSIAERDRPDPANMPGQITLGTLAAVDDDEDGEFDQHSFTTTTPGVTIQGDQLLLDAGAIASLDFEVLGPQFNVVVTATDRNGAGLSSPQKTFTFALTDQVDYFVGTNSAETITGATGGDLLRGLDGNDTLRGLGGNDSLFGGNGNDALEGGDGADSLYGEAADDTLDGGAGDDLLDGGSGSDTATYLSAGAGVTVSLATAGAQNTVGAGVDTLVGVEKLIGSIYADTLTGDGAANELVGGDGADSLSGGGGDDLLAGNAGNDVLNGGTGDDTLNGELGDDDIYGGDGADTINGGDGLDDLYGDAGVDVIDGGAGADAIYGGDGDDDLYGGGENDTIYGGAGKDDLYGGAGDDLLEAEAGDDWLYGETGNDTLRGGAHNDTYVIQASGGHDVIQNYDPGSDLDVIGFPDFTKEMLWFEKVAHEDATLDDLKITAIDQNVSVVIQDWYAPGGGGGANFKIDFVLTPLFDAQDVSAEALVDLMDDYTRPTTLAAFDTLRTTDTTFGNQWTALWTPNSPPLITGAPATAQTIDEDATLPFTIRAVDTNGVVLPSQVNVTWEQVGGPAGLIGSVDLVRVGTDGDWSVVVRPMAQASGSATVRLTATEAGVNPAYKDVVVDVTPVADQPEIQNASVDGTALIDGPIGIPLVVLFPDTDGSETHVVEISGVPADLKLSRGTRQANGVWKLEDADLLPASLLALQLQLETATPPNYANNVQLQIVAKATENGSTVPSATWSLGVPINARPTSLALSASSVNENAQGAIVGTLTRVDPDDAADGALDPATYTFTAGGNPNNFFAIEEIVGSPSISATLKLASGVQLNYEAYGSDPAMQQEAGGARYYNVGLRVTDAGGQEYTETVKVYVTDVNEAPTDFSFINTTTLIPELTSANPVAANRIKVADLNVADDALGTESFPLSGADAASFEVIGTTLYLKAGVTLNREVKASYTVNVAADDTSVGLTPDVPAKTFTVTIGDENDAPTGFNFSGNYFNEVTQQNTSTPITSLAENTLLNSDDDWIAVARINVTDDAMGTNLISHSGDSVFRINGVYLEIHESTVFDFETNADGYSTTVYVTDQQSGQGPAGQVFTLNITDRNEEPTSAWLTGQVTSIAENASTASRTAVATINWADDAFGTETLSLSGQDHTWFEIIGTTLYLKAGVTLDYDDPTYRALDVTVTVDDLSVNEPYPPPPSVNFTLNVTNVEEAPKINGGAAIAYFTVPENQDLGGPWSPLTGAPLSVTDPETTAGMTWTIDNPDGRWSAAGGQLTYQQGGLEYEPQDVFNIVVRATDATGLSDTINVQISTTNSPEQPSASIAETGSYQFGYYGTVTYYSYTRIAVTDPDGGATWIETNASTLPYDTQSIITGYETWGYNQYNQWVMFAWQYPQPNQTWAFTARDDNGGATNYILRVGSGLSLAPIVVDLDGDGLDLVSATSSHVRFDADGDGAPNRTGWVAADDGLLALDRNGDGAITGGSEISFIGDLPGAISDLQGLRAFDTNADGIFDAADARFGEFRIWRDANQDGVSQTSELFALADLGIAGLDLAITSTGASAEGATDNVVTGMSRFIRADGTEGLVGDATFLYEKIEFRLDETAAPPAATQAASQPEAVALDEESASAAAASEEPTSLSIQPWHTGDIQLSSDQSLDGQADWLRGALLRQMMDAEQRFATSVTARDASFGDGWQVSGLADGEAGKVRQHIHQLIDAMSAFEPTRADRLDLRREDGPVAYVRDLWATRREFDRV